MFSWHLRQTMFVDYRSLYIARLSAYSRQWLGRCGWAFPPYAPALFISRSPKSMASEYVNEADKNHCQLQPLMRPCGYPWVAYAKNVAMHVFFGTRQDAALTPVTCVTSLRIFDGHNNELEFCGWTRAHTKNIEPNNFRANKVFVGDQWTSTLGANFQLTRSFM